MIKNKINGMNINKIEFKLLKTTSPSLLNIPNTAIPRNIVWYFEKSWVIFSFIFVLFFKMYFVSCAKINGITITIKIE